MSAVLGWYDREARDLPWRRPEASAWSVMVSEFMLQQTPVARVLEPWAGWLERWPTPVDLAVAPVGEAIRAWGRLGYPRRAVRLHAAAGFAYGQRHVVLDTNVRRVLARVVLGEQHPGGSPAAERRVAEELLPRTRARAARWAVASMELGALVCRARAPRCDVCPVARWCRWQNAGRPGWSGPPRRGQTWVGTDRQCRGALLACVRDVDGPVPATAFADAWPDRVQRDRALASLLVDGLLVESRPGSYALPA